MRRLYASVVVFLCLLALNGCGSSNRLQSITLTNSRTGTLNLVGEGGTVQFKVIGNYTNATTRDITSLVTYTVTPDQIDVFGAPLPAPPQTVLMSPTGLLTAVQPFTCTWKNAGASGTPAWVITGSYKVVASLDGVDSQPMFVPVASSAGLPTDNGKCGPTT